MRILSRSVLSCVLVATTAAPLLAQVSATASASTSVVSAAATRSHPWASFPQGAWVEVQVQREMVSNGSAPAKWDADFRLSVGKTSSKAVTVHRAASGAQPEETAQVTIPAVTALPGVRALGQWPQDLFSIGPKRPAGSKGVDKQRHPQGIETRVVNGKEVTFKDRTFDAKIITRTWTESVGGKDRAYVMKAWVVDGFELPVKWTMSLDGEQRAESKIVKLAEAVSVAKKDIPCFVTETTVTMPAGKMVKRRWTNRGVPGFMVKMESRMKMGGIVLEMGEQVSAFQASAEAAKAGSSDDEEQEGRPAFGFMPDYEAEVEGALVGPVTEGGAAGAAGMLEGDMIVEIDDESIMSFRDYMEVLGSLGVGQKVLVTIERDGKPKLLTIVVGQRGH